MGKGHHLGRTFLDGGADPGARVYAARIIGPAKNADESGKWFGQIYRVWVGGQWISAPPNLAEADIRTSISNLRGAVTTAGGARRFGRVEIVEFALVEVATHPHHKQKG